MGKCKPKKLLGKKKEEESMKFVVISSSKLLYYQVSPNVIRIYIFEPFQIFPTGGTVPYIIPI